MSELGFTVKKNLASTIKDYLRSKGRNVSEEDINTILQRLVDVNSKRTKKESIFTGGHKYFGGSEKDFIVQKDQQINLSVDEYNKIFDGYLEKEQETTLSEEALKSSKHQAFKVSLSNMSDKQLNQIANSANLTTDIEQLKLIAQEFRARGDEKGAESIEKTIKAIESHGKDEQETIETLSTNTAEEVISQDALQPETESEQTDKKEIKINPSEEEIQENITNLNQGESYTYLTVKDQNSWGFGKNQKPVTWTRNEDNTLTRMEPDFKIDGNFGALTEIYTADGKKLLSRTKLGSGNLTKGLYTTTKYSDSKPSTESTDLSNIYMQDDISGQFPNSLRILRLLSPEVHSYKKEVFKNNAIEKDNQTFASKEVKNANGQIVLTYKDGKMYDNKGNEIDNNQALKIIEENLEKKNLSELVKNYNT